MPRRPRSDADLIRELTVELRRTEDPLTFARLADLLREQGRLVEARSMCDQCIARYPSYMTVRMALARVCEAQGDLDRAERELRVVVGAEPHNRTSRVALGQLLLQRGAAAEARQHLEHALFLAPGDAAVRALLARAVGQQAAGVGTYGARTETPRLASAEAVDDALAHLDRTEGVQAAVLVDAGGLLIGSCGRLDAPDDVVSALANETWQLAGKYVVRMKLGTLRQATILGPRHVFILAPTGPGLLAVATTPSAKLGLVNLQIETAKDTLAGI